MSTCSSLVRLRFGRGLAAVREVAQTEALLSQARASLQPLRIDLEAQMNRLDVLLGVQPGTSAPELATPRDIPSVPSVSANDGPFEVLRRRPDVIAAERRLAASNARIGQALAGYYPKISLAGVLGYESSSPSDLFKAATLQPQGIAGLRWRVFDFGKVSAEVAQAGEPMLRHSPATNRRCCARQKRSRTHSHHWCNSRPTNRSCSPKSQPSSGREMPRKRPTRAA